MTSTEPLYTPVDPDEVPADQGRAKRYDGLIEEAFANPGQWYRVNRTFTSRQTASGIRKAYEHETDTEGNVVVVRTVPQNGSFAVYVSVQPSDAPDETDD